jgi:4-hydroxybenzoate polyprenyltransferase
MSATTSPITAGSRLRTYASFVRFEHTLFSLPLLLAGIFSTSGPAIGPWRWALIAVAAVGARTSAMALNRLIDRRLDALNPRTRARELPAGRMRLAEAWMLLAVSIAAYLAACAALGPWFLAVSPIPLVVFVGYPFLKRVTPFCHLGVGLGLAIAPLAGFAATHPKLERPWVALWLALFMLLWASGFDIIYATLDEEFDREQGVRSMVEWLGRERALAVSSLLHRFAHFSLLGAGIVILREAGAPTWSAGEAAMAAAWLGVGVLLFLEQRWAENVNLAFFKVNVWVGFAVLTMVLVARAATGGF